MSSRVGQVEPVVSDRANAADVRLSVTTLLDAHTRGEAGALDRLMALVYDDLRRLARSRRRRAAGDSLDSAAIVHDAYLRLVDQSQVAWRDRGHFFAVCALAMRQIVVDRARRRASLKRGGDRIVVSIEPEHEPAAHDAAHVLEIDLALRKLAGVDARLARVVECRFFAGLSEQETAAALGVSPRTVQREWLKARAWLRTELQGGR
jgi:RNA polymerase sigma factor (TIGR02999 family)